MTTEWWHPGSFDRKVPYLKERARIIAAIRSFFDRRGYLEVDTPALQAAPCMEPHIQAFRTDGFYLHTSPEFAMKKLLVAGLPKIYQLARVFRKEEPSRLHSPEFTMLEWYQTGLDYKGLMQETTDLIRAVTKGKIRDCDPHAPWEVLTVVDALKKYAGVDISNNLPCHPERSEGSQDIAARPRDPSASPQDDSSLEFLRSEAKRIGVYVSPQDDWENALLKIMMDKVEPKLGVLVPTIICDYPVSMAALSRPKPEDPRFAERFEVYICNVELSNGFGELTDAKVQRERFLHDVTQRRKIYGDDYPVDTDFLRAIDFGLKPCSGNALGIDRLVMLLTGAEDIELVQAAPVRKTPHPGWTALHYMAAAEAEGADVAENVKMLLAAGADPHQADDKGDTAFNIAAPASPLTGRLMTLHWLAGRGSKGLNERSGSHGSTLAQYMAKWLNDDEIAGEIGKAAANGLDLDIPNATGWTPLIAAAAMGRVKAVEVLLKFYSKEARAVQTADPYQASGVTYAAGLDALGVVRARLVQDRSLSFKMKEGLERCVELLIK